MNPHQPQVAQVLAKMNIILFIFEELITELEELKTAWEPNDNTKKVSDRVLRMHIRREIGRVAEYIRDKKEWWGKLRSGLKSNQVEGG